MKSPKRKQIVRRHIEIEHLSEEAQVLYQILTSHFLTSRWRALKTYQKEISYLMALRGVYHADTQHMDRLILTCMGELENSGHLGFYVGPLSTYYFREARGRVCVSSVTIPNKQELVNRLVGHFGYEFFPVEVRTLLVMGEILRSVGIDWENRASLLLLIDAMHRMKLFESITDPLTGLPLASLSTKVRTLYEDHQRGLLNHSDGRGGEENQLTLTSDQQGPSERHARGAGEEPSI